MSKKNSAKHFLKLGNKYNEEKKYDLAIENYENFLKEKPNNLEVLKKIADAYYNNDKHLLSIEYLKKIISIMPNDVISVNQIGVCYYNNGMYKEAIVYFNKTIEHFTKILNFNGLPNSNNAEMIKNLVSVYSNLGLSYIEVKNVKDAEIAFKNALKFSDKKTASNYGSLANLYFYNKNYDLSCVFYDKTLKVKFENNASEKEIQKELYNKSFALLAKKNFKEGFILYQSRLFSNNIHPQTKCEERVELPFFNYWDGLEDTCETLFIVYEQGFGDNIQFYRFILELMDIKPELKIKYFTRDTIINVFKKNDRIDYFSTFSKDKIVPNSKKVYIMSLPFYLGYSDITSNKIDYINTNIERVEYWKEVFKPLKRMKVGLVGTGLLISVFEKKISLESFSKLFDLDIDFIYISKLQEIEKDPDYIKVKDIENLHFYDIDKDEPFVDTIAILKNIDLLISVDTAIIHIAGIMNVKTWCLLGYFSDWRWRTDDFSYWYNTVELLRVKKENTLLSEIIPYVKDRLINELATYKVNNSENNLENNSENISNQIESVNDS